MAKTLCVTIEDEDFGAVVDALCESYRFTPAKETAADGEREEFARKCVASYLAELVQQHEIREAQRKITDKTVRRRAIS